VNVLHVLALERERLEVLPVSGLSGIASKLLREIILRCMTTSFSPSSFPPPIQAFMPVTPCTL